jgi:hypothetical protein
LFQASQAASMISSKVSKTRLESQWARRYCQMFSTGFNSGAREGNSIKVMLAGISEIAGGVPPGAIEYERGVRSFGDVSRDFLEVELHGLGVGEGQREPGPDPARGTDRAEQIGALVALIGGLRWPGSSPRPLSDEAVLLPYAGFVLKPDFEPSGHRQVAQMRAQRAWEVFLKASTVGLSCLGWRGRALTCEKPSFFRSVPTYRS